MTYQEIINTITNSDNYSNHSAPKAENKLQPDESYSSPLAKVLQFSVCFKDSTTGEAEVTKVKVYEHLNEDGVETGDFDFMKGWRPADRNPFINN